MPDAALARWQRAAAELVWDQPVELLYAPDDDAWFVGGRLNLAANLLDRHLPEHGNRPALRWEGEPGDRRTLTYRELHADVLALARGLAELGVGVGDRVALYAGLLPETVTAMLACARLGAAWSVLPAVLPTDALSARLQDLRPRVLVTQDGAWRHGVVLPLKSRADEALTASGTVEHTVVVRRAGIDVAWYAGDQWMHELVAAPRGEPGPPPRPSVPAGAPALVTHAASRRGRPTGVVHTTAGLLAYARELHARGLGLGPGQVSWVPAEIGWIAAQTQGLLGPLSVGGTALAYEGMLDTPRPDRAWELIEHHGVEVLVATPSVVRAVRRLGEHGPRASQVASLQAIVTAGEPLDEDTRSWLRDHVGHGELEVSDAWGQTELGGLVQLAPTLSAAGGPPDPGLEIVDEAGRPRPPDGAGDLVLTHPWPATARYLDADHPRHGVDPARPGLCVTGDRARRRPDGTVEFLGRSDRVLNVSGQLVSATEIGDVLRDHPLVQDAVVVDRPDRRTGRAVVACVVPATRVADDADFAAELAAHVRTMLGGLAQPRSMVLLDVLPALGDDELTRTLGVLCADAPAVSRMRASRVVAAARASDA